MAFTPSQPPPWYNKAELTRQLSSQSSAAAVSPQAITIPEDTNKGLVGIGWLLLVMIPAGIGGGILQPSINSMITKRVGANERGGILGASSSMSSAANVIAPLMGGVLFQANSGLPFIVWGIIMEVLFLLARLFLKPEPACQRIDRSTREVA